MNQEQRFYYLQAMGITPFVLRKDDLKPNDLLSETYQEANTCHKCSLCDTRTNVVFGRGNKDAKLMIIGEAPGFNEDKEGKPFVGRAGKLLDKMLLSIGLRSDDIYICNIIKCRPPDNRDPKIEEILACSPYLEKQIAIVAPQIILAVGRIAGHFLTGTKDPLYKMRNGYYLYNTIPLKVSYHPAYLLRNPKDKKKSYQDLLLLKRLLEN